MTAPEILEATPDEHGSELGAERAADAAGFGTRARRDLIRQLMRQRAARRRHEGAILALNVTVEMMLRALRGMADAVTRVDVAIEEMRDEHAAVRQELELERQLADRADLTPAQRGLVRRAYAGDDRPADLEGWLSSTLLALAPTEAEPVAESLAARALRLRRSMGNKD